MRVVILVQVFGSAGLVMHKSVPDGPLGISTCSGFSFYEKNYALQPQIKPHRQKMLELLRVVLKKGSMRLIQKVPC